MQATEENRSRLTPGAEFVASGQVAVEQVPHRRPRIVGFSYAFVLLIVVFGYLPYGKRSAAASFFKVGVDRRESSARRIDLVLARNMIEAGRTDSS
jgi:hypothetical protein